MCSAHPWVIWIWWHSGHFWVSGVVAPWPSVWLQTMLKTNSTRVMARHCSIHSQRQTWNLRLDTETLSEENPFNKPVFFGGFHVFFVRWLSIFCCIFVRSDFGSRLTSGRCAWVFSRWFLFCAVCVIFFGALIQPLSNQPPLVEDQGCSFPVQWCGGWSHGVLFGERFFSECLSNPSGSALRCCWWASRYFGDSHWRFVSCCFYVSTACANTRYDHNCYQCNLCFFPFISKVHHFLVCLVLPIFLLRLQRRLRLLHPTTTTALL